jgi:hypothetical protein
MFKVYAKGDDGRWCLHSIFGDRGAAEMAVTFLMYREGILAKVML